MTETLAARNREAIEHQLSHPEFLALLIQDEVARREQKKYAMRFRRAGFRHNKTLESFDLDFNPNFNQALLKELASGGFIEEKVAVLIAGPCGTGKSHLAQALGHCAVQKGYDVLCHSQAKLLSYLHAARATNTYDRRFQSLVKVPLLIIDDFGLKPLKSPQDEDLHDLIDERYERGATIVTSNLDFGEWGDAFPNKLLGAATLDRLRHHAYRVVLDGESYRTPRPCAEKA
ncbi:PREDICTED: putative ATP-binding protein Rv3427c in insertion sequence [Priapulus caudatus]|uniref:ATP-binding protein Rv3427c in insertion sequence n=1 Tax=Priapulus caudatus TaxID=37621 RepID=A0ABM1F5U1_PRICU|nr:PREDICTED: putative ATP-binding protein Rv3427c in insertion sequence [Priapulus caudatus]